MKQTSALSLRLLIRSLLQENSGEDAPFETFEQIKGRFKRDPVARAYALFERPERAVLPGAEIDDEYLRDIETAALSIMIVRMEQIFDEKAASYFRKDSAREIYDKVRTAAVNETMQGASAILARSDKMFDLLEEDYNELLSKLDIRLKKQLRESTAKHGKESNFKYHVSDAWWPSSEDTSTGNVSTTNFMGDEDEDYIEWSKTVVGHDTDD